ncbi:MAG: choice-of-anchor D domain-containing protein [Candidatus Acidiferrum sp.]
MAPKRDFLLVSGKVPLFRAMNYWKNLIVFSILALATANVPSARAQFQQPLVFSSAGAVAVRNDQSGLLTPVSGSPFTTANQSLTIDVQGRFLFAITTNSIRMFQITDSTTGAYLEVANSPFASPNTNQPAFIAVEPAGKYIAVVNRVGQNPGDGSVETFQIAPAAPGGPALIPVAGSATELDSTAIGFAQPPDNKEFLLFMGANPFSQDSAIVLGSEFQALSIDPQTGFLTGYQQDAALSQRGDSFAMDPQGRYYVTGTQDNLLEFGMVQLLGIGGDGLFGNVQLPQQSYPQGLWIDSTGTFLYVAISNLANPVVVNIYSVDVQTGRLAETSSSPLPGFTSAPPYYADPTGSFNYGFGSDQNSAIAYTVDPQTGYFVETSNSPFVVPQIAGVLTFSIAPGQQGISGPAASFSATNLSFGTIQTGSPSMAQTITLTSNGGQALSVDSISLGGADPSQFQEMDTCQTPSVLQPTKFCSISITFTPTDAGPQQATLSITDDAAGSPQSITLAGAGVAPPPPAPAVAVTPDPVSFPTITQGTTSSSIVVTVTNSGNATLDISSVTLGGNNPGDFQMTNACSGAYAANAGCTITLRFTPLAAGQRSAIISISDDAQNSPQAIQVSGTATSAPSTKPALSFSSTSLSFPVVTQGMTNGPQNVTITSSGGAALHISSVVLGGANSNDFSMTNGCTAPAYAVNATCTIGVSFAPLAAGARAATITLTDDAANSPQIISIGGFANSAVTIGAAPSGSTAASVSAGQTAQFNLQLAPGPGYSGTVSLAYSGAPLAASVQGPSTLQISSSNAVQFSVMVKTTGGSSGLLPFYEVPCSTPFRDLRTIPGLTLGIILFLLLVFRARRDSKPQPRPRRLALGAALTTLAFVAILNAAGCGGGSPSVSATTPPQQIVTPQGTSAIMIIPSATSVSGQPLQLQPIQLTLTVN